MYNLTGIQNALYITDLIREADTASNNILVIGFILSIFFVAMLSMKQQDFATNFTVSSFLAFIISALFWYARLVTEWVTIAFFCLMIAGILYSYTRD